MCLTLVKPTKALEITNKLIRNSKDGKVVCWKRLRKKLKGQRCSYNGTVWHKGKYTKSNRIVPTLLVDEIIDNSVNLGIHVYLNKEDISKYEGADNLVRVSCDLKDLVAVGYNNSSLYENAVFMKAKLI